MSAESGSAPFAARTVFIIVAVAVVGFLSYLVLSTYAPDFRPVRNGGAHALSTSAVGFSGTTELIRLTRGDVQLIRKDGELASEGLVILTPGPNTSAGELKAILEKREDMLTLIVLPKWRTQRLAAHPAWVRAVGKWPSAIAMAPLDGTVEAGLIDEGVDGARSIHGKNLRTIEKTAEGRPLLVEIGDTPHYILADPDVIDNRGLATLEGAERAMAMLDRISTADEPTAFDLTLMGFGRNPNLLKLALEPPFLPLTLCLLFAALLAGLHAARRFGPTLHEGRKVAFGKRALAENGAALLRLARRRHRTGGRYATLTREAVAAASGAPPGLTGDALDRYLDGLTREGEAFTSIAARAEDAPDTRRLLKAARDLYHWRRTVTREH
jgi:hypothetical protein